MQFPRTAFIQLPRRYTGSVSFQRTILNRHYSQATKETSPAASSSLAQAMVPRWPFMSDNGALKMLSLHWAPL